VSARGADSDGAEYARLWAMVNRAYPSYNYHRERAGRHILLMVLEPVSAPAG